MKPVADSHAKIGELARLHPVCGKFKYLLVGDAIDYADNRIRGVDSALSGRDIDAGGITVVRGLSVGTGFEPQMARAVFFDEKLMLLWIFRIDDEAAASFGNLNGFVGDDKELFRKDAGD